MWTRLGRRDGRRGGRRGARGRCCARCETRACVVAKSSPTLPPTPRDGSCAAPGDGSCAATRLIEALRHPFRERLASYSVTAARGVAVSAIVSALGLLLERHRWRGSRGRCLTRHLLCWTAATARAAAASDAFGEEGTRRAPPPAAHLPQHAPVESDCHGLRDSRGAPRAMLADTVSKITWGVDDSVFATTYVVYSRSFSHA